MKDKRLMGSFLLLITSIIWGFAFVAQSEGMEHVGPYTFQSIRCLLGAAALTPIILIQSRKDAAKKKNMTPEERAKGRKELLRAGFTCGIFFTVSCCLQQVGILYTTVGKAGFLTSLYLVLVPIFGFIFFKEKIGGKIIFCVLICFAGIYLLSINEELRISRGDVLILLCAVGFACHILSVDRLAANVDGVKVSCMQFLMSFVLAGIPMMLWEHPTLEALLQAGPSILYAGVMSCGIAYTLQIVGQKYAPPTTATIILSMESVFALIGGVFLLHQIPSTRESIGCVLVFAAVILAQIPVFEGKKGKE